MRKHVFGALAAASALVLIGPAAATSDSGIEFRALDGGGNNLAHPDWGRAGTLYTRVAPPAYPDGIGAMEGGPPARYVSNRIFNDLGQNVFSENDVSQIGWLWGQFVDHTLDLRDETPAENAPIPFDATDPLESFTDDFGQIDFARTPAAPGTGTSTSNPRQQVNTVNSFIDGWNVYGGSATRLDWLRAGTVDGDPTNNAARLLLPNNFLPFADARGDASKAPVMDLFGAQVGNPASAVVAGDVRANENMGLTAIQTLFAREHNRIVAQLNANPLTSGFTSELKFQIARRVVGAEEQYITYNEFLPALGVRLPAYHGYDPTVDPSISNEFATVGFRAHSQIHGEMEPLAGPNAYSASTLAAMQAQGVEVESTSPVTHLVIPLDLTFGNPQLLTQVGVGPLLKGLAAERQYNNDEQFDNQLRSVLFEISSSPTNQCLDLPDPACFSDVSDLAAIDVARGRDHGMPTYNQLRIAYGLAPAASFTDVTGETSDAFAAGTGIDTPSALAFTQLRDMSGNVVPLGTPDAQEDAVADLRGSPLAARLKAIYGSVDNLDAFVGMVCERHLPGSELGPLQYAIWAKQFAALRDGDRFFYANDAYLNDVILGQYGIDYRKTLAQIIEADSNASVQADVFKAPIEPGADSVGLVAAYSFDEGAGTTVHDASGRGNDGAATNATWVAGKYGSALSFNGSSSWVTVPGTGSLDLTQGMTLEAWVRPNALAGSWRTVLFKQQAGGGGMEYSLYANDGNNVPVGQAQIGGEQNAEGSAALPLLAWSYLAATYDGTTETLYVNGNPVATIALSGPIDVSDGVLRIGGNSVWPEWFSGRIDEVRVYNRALSQDEIRIDMATPVSAFPNGPRAAPAVIGEQHVEPDSNPANASGISEAYPSVATTTETVGDIHVYMDDGTTAGTLWAGLYADDGGHPGQLLAAGSLDTPVANAWNTVAVPAVQLTAGTTYWIAVLGTQGGQLAYRDRCCSVAGQGPTETEADPTLTRLPAQWVTGTVYDDAPISAYATG